MQLYGVIGHPISHSLSPVLHNWAFKKFGYKDKVYIAWDITPKNLEKFLHNLDIFQVKGLSVTIPHKQNILSFAQKISPLAQKIQAANTLVYHKGIWLAENTDVYGFIQPLQQLNIKLQKALILGAGGASLAVIYGLKKLKIEEIYISNRTMSKARQLAKNLGLKEISWEDKEKLRPDILINTTPLGMSGKWQNKTPWNADLKGIKVVYDIIYNPNPTLLLKQAKKFNCTTISGLEMFIYQAQQQFKLFTGQTFSFYDALNYLNTNTFPRK